MLCSRSTSCPPRHGCALVRYVPCPRDAPSLDPGATQQKANRQKERHCKQRKKLAKLAQARVHASVCARKHVCVCALV
eukprot:1147703-Pelagomonas_calceolata.AAC.4